MRKVVLTTEEIKLGLLLDKILDIKKEMQNFYLETFNNSKDFHIEGNKEYIKLLKVIFDVNRIRGRGRRFHRYHSDLPLKMASKFHVYLKEGR
jgi:hypothetical protein